MVAYDCRLEGRNFFEGNFHLMAQRMHLGIRGLHLFHKEQSDPFGRGIITSASVSRNRIIQDAGCQQSIAKIGKVLQRTTYNTTHTPFIFTATGSAVVRG